MDFALLCILLLKLLQFTSGRGTLKMNAYTTIECHMRVFEFNVTATKYDTFEGKVVMCHTMTKVKSCWGRCDSNEVQKRFIIGQVQKIWPQRPYSSEKLGKLLFIVFGVLKICVVGLSSCTLKCVKSCKKLEF